MSIPITPSGDGVPEPPPAGWDCPPPPLLIIDRMDNISDTPICLEAL
jgi:hypothetical protein